MAALRAMVLLMGLACIAGSVLKANRPNIIRMPRSIDISAAHSLINEPRLDGEVKPKGYKLELEPYISEGIFKGSVVINITWAMDSDVISLHAHQDLQILETYVRAQINDPAIPAGNLTLLTISRANRNPKKPIYVIRLSKEQPKGTIGEIEMTFEGKLETENSEAFFIIQPPDKSLTGTIVGLQLKPNYARRVFPSFDEPTYRIPFDISVLRPKQMTALSNTPVRCSEEVTQEGKNETEKVWDHFERTPPIPTYGVGLIISDLRKTFTYNFVRTDPYNTSIVVSIWCRYDFKEEISSSYVVKTMDSLFDDTFQIDLPIKKLDIVAVPNYLGVKPADSLGLILFKENELTAKSYLILAQELSYQWIGGLTSPAWWIEARINKALVGYISAATAIKIDQGAEMDGKWPMTMLYSLYYEFSKRYPHSRITGLKQETACSKIELIFRMLNYTLGEKTFKKGIREFISTRPFQTFSSDDVWFGFHAAAREDKVIPIELKVLDFANSWIFKDRLPVVNIVRNYEKQTAIARQRVYLRERPHDVPGQDKLLWTIPLVVTRQDDMNFRNTTPMAWMEEKEIELKNLTSKDQFIIVNPEEIGPFPVNYDVHNWNMLAQFLMSDRRTDIPVFTRAKLLHDGWNLAYAGDLSFATALNMTLFLKNERNHLVWDPVFTMIDHIGRHIDSSDVHKKFETYVRMLLTPLYEELGQTKEDDEGWKVNLRTLSKTFLCRAGYRPCIEEAQSAFKLWMDAANPEEGNPVPNQYICPVFKWGSQEEWEFGLERIINFPPSRKPSERTYLLKTLAGCPITKWKIQKLLKITILESNGNFTENDIFLIFSMLTGGSRGYTTLFDFLEQHWDAIRFRFENKTNLWDNLISSATSVFTTQEGLDMVTKLYVERQGEFGSAEHIIEKSLKNIREETKWSDENLPVIEKWLDEYLSSVQVEDKKFIGYEQ